MVKTAWLICRRTGEATVLDWDRLGHVVKIEQTYIAETMATDGMFMNGFWIVRAERQTDPECLDPGHTAQAAKKD